LKDAATLRAMFDAAGVKPGQEVVTYCHIGLQGSLLYAAARQLGHPARLYDGSFQDWSHNTSFPVATAPGK
jgi:thiosulfate/3-mercaptopyruvate sulfurtransferase